MQEDWQLMIVQRERQPMSEQGYCAGGLTANDRAERASANEDLGSH